jgi:hypothetical protein
MRPSTQNDTGLALTLRAAAHRMKRDTTKRRMRNALLRLPTMDRTKFILPGTWSALAARRPGRRKAAGPRTCATKAPARLERIARVAAMLGLVLAAAGPWAAASRAQGSRKDDIVFNTRGQPLAGAQVRVCTSSATTTSPCTPLANIYSDLALSQALANPTATDGLGNYNFYAAAGRYVIEVSGPGITTQQIRDVILPSDPSQPADFTGDAISALSLTLSGNLTVSGSTAVTGTLSVGGAPVPSTAAANTWTAAQTYSAAVTLNNPGGNVTQKPAAADGTMYASPNGNDSNDGLSQGTAKATIYTALCSLPGGNCSTHQAGSGTIGIANGTQLGGPVTGQGIWVMGSSDPNYSSPPTGWLKWGGPVTFNCVGTDTTAAVNNIQSGTCGIHGANTGAMGPFIWLSGSVAQNYTFDHISTLDYPNICVRLGVDSNGNRANGLGGAQLNIFQNFGCHVANTTSAGPGVDIGSNTFWDWFNFISILSNTSATGGLSADQNQAVVVNPSTGASSGLLFFLNDTMNSGGIKYYPGSVSSSELTVTNLTTEANVKAAVWFTSSNQYMTANVDTVTVADCSGTCPAVEVDGTGPAAAVRVSNLQGSLVNVTGPVTSIGGDYLANYQNEGITPTGQGQVGVFGNRIVGQQDSARRQFGPVSVRYANLASASNSGWSTASCDAATSLTTGFAAPDGTSGAGRASKTASGNGCVSFYRQSTTLAVGDYLIFGVWARSVAANGFLNGQPSAVVFGTSGFTCTNGNNMASASQWVEGDGQWEWDAGVCKVATIGTNPADLNFYGAINSTESADFYGPVLMHIPTGTISTSEAADIAQHLESYANGVAAGSLATVQGLVPVGNPVHKLEFPWAHCNAGTASALWAPSASNTGGGAVCTGDNQTAYIELKDGDVYYYDFTLPNDFQSFNAITLSLVADDSTAAHTLISSAAVYCIVPSTNSGEATSPTYLTAGTATTTIPSSAGTDVLYSAAITNMSMSGCTAGSYARLKFSRGTDTATGNLYVLGALVFSYNGVYGQ